jgi:hypothetical protein
MKHAIRILLPVEMLLGLYTMLWGLSGGGIIGDGALYYALQLGDDNFAWCVTLGSVGASVFLVAAAEWLFGKARECAAPALKTGPADPFFRIRWAIWMVHSYLFGWVVAARSRLSTPRSLHKFASARATLAFIMVGAWVGAAMVILTSNALDRIAMLYWAAVLHVIFSCWIYHENLKLRYLLDEKIPTRALELSQ